VRIVFWGTSSFAVPALRALLGEGFDVAGVVTQPDRAVGRSRSTLVPSPVKSAALDEELPVFQPESPADEAFLTELRALEPELSIVVSYGHILRPSLIALPTLGTINVHASLLPALRGAAPIQGAIRAGLAETGVTVMRMVQALDAGPIMLQSRTPIARDETAGELETRLSELGALALVEALTLMSLGKLTETPQDDA
jgi:methionyl-tRNA formyltransferase